MPRIPELPLLSEVNDATSIAAGNATTGRLTAAQIKAYIGPLTSGTGTGTGPPLATTTPAALSTTAAVGVSASAARADHVHLRPSLAELGAAPTAHGHAQIDIVGLTAALSNRQLTAEKDVANGYAGLGSDGRISTARLPTTLLTTSYLAGVDDFTADFTVAQGDNNRVKRCTSTADRTVSLAALAVGTTIRFIQGAAGKITFVGTGGASVSGFSGFTRTAGPQADVVATVVASSTWNLSGALVAAASVVIPPVVVPTSGRTLIGAQVGPDAASALALESWMGKQFDGFLSYTAGYAGWDGLAPNYVLSDQSRVNSTGRRLLWSIMMIPDGDANQSVNWYREVASGARNAQFNTWGDQLIAHHNSIGDTTGPIYVRTAWEVPGEWFYWNQAAVIDPAAFRDAWAQFATSIRNGRPRIKTVFDFNSDRGPIEYLYPGDQYIDIIGQDIYWIHDLQGTNPVAAFNHSRHGYSRGLQWNLDWCRSKNKPLAISEFGVKLTQIDPASLDCAAWFQEFFNFVDECNQPGNPGMAYVTWWDDDQANVGKFTTLAPAGQQSAVRNIFRARML